MSFPSIVIFFPSPCSIIKTELVKPGFVFGPISCRAAAPFAVVALTTPNFALGLVVPIPRFPLFN